MNIRNVTAVVIVAMLLCSCRPHPTYMCHCNNAQHPDSNTSFRVGEPGLLSKDSATTLCQYYHTYNGNDSCFVLVENVGTPM